MRRASRSRRRSLLRLGPLPLLGVPALHLERVRPPLLAGRLEGHVAGHGAHAAVGVQDARRQEPRPEHPGDDGEGDEEERRRGVRVRDGLVPDRRRRVHAPRRHLHPAVQRCHHEQRQKGVTCVVEVVRGVDPTPRDRVAAELVPGGRKRPEVPEPRDVFERAVRVCFFRLRREPAPRLVVRGDERADALVPVRHGAVRAAPELPGKELHAEDREHQVLEQPEQKHVHRLRERERQRRRHDARAPEPLHQPQRPQRARDSEGADRRERVRAREHRQHGSRGDSAVHGVPRVARVRAGVRDEAHGHDLHQSFAREKRREGDIQMRERQA